MKGLPLFFRSVELLHRERHRQLRLRTPDSPFGYAASAQFVPALVDEFAVAAREYPIAFVQGEKGPVAVLLCGLRSQQNLFVDVAGRWTGSHVPAYLRRYPFILGEREGAAAVVCIDAAYPGFVDEGAGARLFDDTGAATETLDRATRFASEFAVWATRTDAFAAFLVEHDLLRAVTFDVTGPASKTPISIRGVSIVDEQKLNALPADVFEDLRSRGYLGVVYAHLFSLGALQALAGRALADESAATEAA